MIRLRFVQGTAVISRMIIAQEKTAMPFCPSHVEVVSRDGISYIGAQFDGGVQRLPIGYDAGQVAHELILDLEATAQQYAAFHDFIESKIGEPYDFAAILGFVIPLHEHTKYHAICSAIVLLGLRRCGWFQWPVAVPAHLVDPRDLLLMISGRMAVPDI